jgi:hypothetical protein
MTVYYDMTNEEYHSSDALSASGAKTIAMKSPAHYKYEVRKANPAWDLGTAAHTLVFEPHLANSVWIGPETRRGKAWTERKAEAEESGALLLTEGDYKIANDMANAVRANKSSAELLSGDLICEASVFGVDAVTDVKVRSRPLLISKQPYRLIQKASPSRLRSLAITSKRRFTAALWPLKATK